MSTTILRVERNRTSRRRPQHDLGTRPEWLEVAEAGILYFGVTLLPLLLVILLYQLGVIA